MGFIENLEKELFEMQDLKYRDFHSRLLPGIDKETIIGIRTPMLRKFTKEYAKTPEADLFMQELPHRYYEENNMHMMIASWIKDYEKCLAQVKRFLPYVNNWRPVTSLHRRLLQNIKMNCFRRSAAGSRQMRLIRSVMESAC